MATLMLFDERGKVVAAAATEEGIRAQVLVNDLPTITKIVEWLLRVEASTGMLASKYTL